MNKKTCYICSGCLFAAFLVLIVFLKTYDIDCVGPAGTSVGFSHFNKSIHDFLGTSSVWYLISKLLGLLEIGLGAAFIAGGAFFIARSKGAYKYLIPHLCGMFILAAMFSVYVLFELIAVNYRPVIEEGALLPEPSFPSTHTMIAITVMGVFVLFAKCVIVNQKTVMVLYIACAAIAVITIVARVLSGVHWATDIFGGALVGAALVLFYKGLLSDVKTDDNV